MADTKGTGLPELTDPVLTDITYVVDDPGGTPVSKKITLSNLNGVLPADAVDAITEIAAALKSGADATLVTGTAGTSGNLAQWNGDGDAVDSGSAAGDFATAAQGATADSALQNVVDDATPQLGGNLDVNGNTITGLDASTTAKGIIEAAIAAELNTGTDAGRAVTPDALAGSNYGTAVVTIQIFDDSTDVSTGDGAGDTLWRVPSTLNGFDLVDAVAYVQTAGTTNATTVQVHNVTQTADMLSSALSIASAATESGAASIDADNDDVATGDKIRIDVDSVSTTAPKGLWVELQFRLP